MALAKPTGMETTKTHRVETGEARGRGAAWFICLALVTVASGCGGCLKQVPDLPDPGPDLGSGCPGGPNCGIVQSLLEEEIDDPKCPPGGCDPGGSGNAKGIYTAEGGNYCFIAVGDKFFCPETFTNTPTGVVLAMRHLDSPLTVLQTAVTGKLEANPNQLVDVLAITSDRTELSIRYRLKPVLGKPLPAEQVAKGEDLTKLILHLGTMAKGSGDASPLVGYDLKFVKEEGVKNGVHRYKLTYQEHSNIAGDSLVWIPHCKEDGANTISFLQGRRVNGLTASVKRDDNATSMGCEKGSIVTCLDWGYTPWNDSGGWDDQREFVFRSCLQAKRAAYFVGKGNYQSYTKPGTKIIKWDQYASGGDKLTKEEQAKLAPHIEALWGPHGAVCFNPQNRRREDPDLWPGQDPKKLDTYGVGPCTSADFTPEGKIFTVPSSKL
ncbi:ADYC domain-containing protein [Archangium gephyra]|uniref:ADYC domain-containing protein n=1 Tax=Archangium gephyra TaxID=48 RepID=UPI0035D45499